MADYESNAATELKKRNIVGDRERAEKSKKGKFMKKKGKRVRGKRCMGRARTSV
jgi:hypothetical protein